MDGIIIHMNTYPLVNYEREVESSSGYPMLLVSPDRFLQLADLPQLNQLYREEMPGMGTTNFSDTLYRRSGRAELFAIALNQDNVIGCGAIRWQPFSHPKLNGDESYGVFLLHSNVVSSEFRRRGIARDIINARISTGVPAITEAFEMQARKMPHSRAYMYGMDKGRNSFYLNQKLQRGLQTPTVYVETHERFLANSISKCLRANGYDITGESPAALNVLNAFSSERIGAYVYFDRKVGRIYYLSEKREPTIGKLGNEQIPQGLIIKDRFELAVEIGNEEAFGAVKQAFLEIVGDNFKPAENSDERIQFWGLNSQVLKSLQTKIPQTLADLAGISTDQIFRQEPGVTIPEAALVVQVITPSTFRRTGTIVKE
jgi:Acetyltransferase (GNAT) family